MLISCEKCKDVFEINERHLNSKGVTALCPHCDHKHRVKRIVIPYSVASEEDTEPYDFKDIMAKNKNAAYIKEDDLSDDLEPVEAKSEVVLLSVGKKNGQTESESDDDGQKAYHIKDRRKGQRGTILDRFVSINFLYLLVAGLLVLGFLIYFITR